jgi:DNA-binding PadR family transcriptional regulator
LEQAGWVTSRWEDPERQEEEGRPRRRYYQLTLDGAEFAKDALTVTYQAGRRVRLAPDSRGSVL